MSQLRPKITALKNLLRPLEKLNHIGDIRQQGFMAGIELVQNRSTKAPFPLAARIGHKVAMEARRRGLLLRPIGNVIILVPPLSTSLPELRRMVEILEEAVEAVAPLMTTNRRS